MDDKFLFEREKKNKQTKYIFKLFKESDRVILQNKFKESN